MIDPANIHYSETTKTQEYTFSSSLNHPESHQDPFDSWIRTKVDLVLHGDAMVDFITWVNVELFPYSQYQPWMDITVIQDQCGDPTSPVQYNIHYQANHSDDDQMKFLELFRAKWDPRNHGWPKPYNRSPEQQSEVDEMKAILNAHKAKRNKK